MSEAIWFFFDPPSKQKMGPYTVPSLSEAVQKNKFDLATLYICQKGWPQWLKASEAPDFMSLYQATLTDLPDLPDLPDLAIEDIVKSAAKSAAKSASVANLILFKQAAPAEELSYEEEERQWSHSRKYKRYGVRLRVIFIAKEKTFRTFTKDISEGGMMLEEKLPPEMCEMNLEVYLASPDQKVNIRLKASLVQNKNRQMSIKFCEINDKNLVILKNWLLTDLKKYVQKKTA